MDFNNCMNSAGLIWRSEPVKQLKWVTAAKIAGEEALKLSQEKDISVKSVPPVMADCCRHLTLIIDSHGRASIKDKYTNFIITDKLCPPLPDEVDR